MRDYELKFEQLPEDQKLFQLRSDAGLKIVEKGQFFIALDEGPDEMKNLCREYTLPRSEEVSRVRGWILENTKIGVCLQQKRYVVEIMVEALFRNRTVSWVTGTSETISLESVEPVPKAKPRPMPTMTLSPISIPVRERNWTDINP